ncbi:conserved hypothetical protein [Candidatus Desulfosporosinus infrequens]|uniref:DUF4145 domain-containing protein n=1 Tax=Candidatus Desulfosporosinus infrequens TaxID=2043169 RepID=A0A2U3LHP8_9FIRM|nr:conserved hypothetical protein [Candidatus Desulfosporosinus infrequens]
MEYTAPEFGLDAFDCPQCGAFAHQIWKHCVLATNGDSNDFISIENLSVSLCGRCKEFSYWNKVREMIYPSKSIAPLPTIDMPEDVSKDYNEARSIFEKSPRASAALLRLAIQKICVALGEKGKNINDDIAILVTKGLPTSIQKALDIVRVVGNNAVHPGEINIDDNPSIALSLFKLLNLIVDTMITQPKEINELFDFLPEGARRSIERRDS